MWSRAAGFQIQLHRRISLYTDIEQVCQCVRGAKTDALDLQRGSGISAAAFQKAIASGIARISSYSGMSEAAIRVTQRCLVGVGDRYNAYPLMMSKVKNAVTGVVAKPIEVLGGREQAVADLHSAY